ncbi:MAG: hypothetical protein MJ118_03635 [Clostridia bacterium]|nr:hypothetical protein [Clostridia bacterium]
MNRKKIRRMVRAHLPMIAAIAALLLLVLVLVLALKGCSSGSAAGITAKALGTDAELVLPLDAQLNNGDFVSYGGYQFETGKKLSAMSKLISKKNAGITAASYDNAYGTCWVFTKPNEANGTDSWCLYQKDPANTKNYYIFMGMHREVSTADGKLRILLPLHLICDSYLRDNMGSRLEPGTAYACGLKKLGSDQTIAALFQGFYEQSGLYNVTPAANGFTIVPKGGDQEITFAFEEAESGSWFTVDVPMPKEPEPSAIASAAWYEDVISGKLTESVSLPEQDAVMVSSILISKNYKSYPAGYEPDCQLNLNGEVYDAWFSWTDNSWTGSVVHNEKVATLTAKEACEIVGVLCANGVKPMEFDESAWPADVTLTPMAGCMVTTADLNVRPMPEASGTPLVVMGKEVAVAVTGQTDNGWYRIAFGDRPAFLSADYLKPAG